MKLHLAGFLLLLAVVGLAGRCAAQTGPCPTQSLQVNPTKSSDLVCLVPQVYGAGGLVGATNGGPLDDTQGHSVHFQASSVRSFGPINAEIGIQLSQLPIATPVAGFLFSGGVVTPTSSFGPVLTDRADTLGKGKLFLSTSYQYFDFDKADGVNLKSFGAVFTHEPEPTVCSANPTGCLNGEPIFTRDIVATQNRIDLKVHQMTLVGTYGISDKFDLSVAVPVLNVRMAITSAAQIYNFEAPPVNHDFINSPTPYNETFTNTGYSFGMGDVTIRAKYVVRQGERSAVAAGADFRIPTGDGNNFLGSGTWGFRPFVIFSGNRGRLSPHATLGVQGNGSTVLAGDITSTPVTKENLPTVFSYSGGTDISLTRRFSVSGDFIGESVLHTSRIATSTFTDFGGNTHADIKTSTDTVQVESVAAGLKINPFGSLLVTANGLFRVNDAGLHSKPVPLVGISYTF